MFRGFRPSRLVPRFIRSSFRAKLFVAFMVLGGLASIDSAQYIGRLLKRIEYTEVRSLMFGTVVQMAEALDAEALERLSGVEDVRSEPAFEQSRSTLIAMRAAIVEAVDRTEDAPVAESVFVDLYVLAPTDEAGQGRLIVTYVEAEAGRLYDMSRFPDMMTGWERALVEDDPATDEYGTTLSAYAPVRDADGNAVALVGIDVAGVYFDVVILETVIITLAMFVAAVLFSLLFAWIISRIMTRSLHRLADGMSRVAGGDLAASIEPFGSGDEFDQLFGQFNGMVAGLRDRETIKRDLVAAAGIQAGLLPTLTPKIAGFDLGGGIRYCDQTGGDYYDYLDLRANASSTESWGIVVGDVTGHGIASALMMCSNRAVLRSAARQAGTDAASLMRYVNAHVVHDSPGGAFMTMFYGVLDPARRRLVWSNAGHEPGLLVRAGTDDVDELRSTDIPLGIDAERAFEAGEPVEFASGDVLVIGTDGISQARDQAGRFFGFTRIADAVRAYADASADEIRDAILRATRLHCGDDQLEDDATIVVLKCTA